MEERRTEPLVSVIIPTYNSQRDIKSCLNSIKKQTYKKTETIVVDRYSVDRTVQIAKQLKAKVLLLDTERSEGKNHAAREAIGDFLLFIDSDMTLNPRVIEECVWASVQRNVEAVIIPEMSSSRGILGDWRKKEKISLSGSAKLVEIPRFIRRTAFLQARGYDETLVCGEDFEFHKRFERCGFRTDRIRSGITHSEGAPSLYGILSKAFHYGRSIPALVKKNPSVTIERYARIRLASSENAGTAFRSSVSLPGFTVMKMLEYMAYFLGISAQLLHRFAEKSGAKRLTDGVSRHKAALANFTIILLISIAIFRNFLFTAEWPGGGDVMGFVSRAYLYGRDFRWLYMWRPYSFGFVEGINFMDFFLMLLYAVFKDPSWTVKTFMFISYLIAAFSMYIFAYRYTRVHVASLVASLAYVLNQWLFSQLTEAHVDIVFSYALAPLIFILLDNALRTGKLRSILFFSIGLSLFVTSFHPESIVIYGLFLAIFAVFYALFPSKTETAKARLLRLLKVSLPSALVVFLLSAFFFVPFMMNVRSPYVRPTYEYPLEDAFMASYQNLTDAFTLRGVEKWGYNNIVDVYSGLALPDFPAYTLLLAIFILAYAVVLIRRDRYTVFFLFSALISLFIAKGPNPPFGQVFIWAWFNVPHFAIFRAANRWVMMAIFSTAFFVSILASLLVGYVKNRPYLNADQRYFKLGVKSGSFSKISRYIVSVDTFSTLFKELHKVLHVLGIILLAFILLSGFISCFFFFSQGLQVYTPPKQYLAPYEWLNFQKDDYKVITVGRSPDEWTTSASQSSDFASSAMQTTLGWGHDIGFDSAFIHDKPVLQDGGWDTNPRRFIDHLRFRLARERLTVNLFKILGAFAYKYIVVPAYATNETRKFFLNQTGYQIVYNQTALVLQNEYAVPRVFATNESMTILGGMESFDALSKIEGFRLNSTTMFFIPATVGQNVLRPEMLEKSQTFTFVDSDVLDLAMISLIDGKSTFLAGSYGVPSINTSAYWAKIPSWRNVGALILSGDTMTTSGKNKVNMEFDLSSDGYYDLWLRMGFAPSRGKLSILIDGEPTKEVFTESPLWSKLAWINVTSLSLTAGKHLLTLENDGTGFNDVDAVAIVKSSDLESRINQVTEILRNYPGRILHVLEAENVFLGLPGTGWYWTLSPGNGYVIHSETLGLNVAPLASANASSVSEAWEAQQAIDGNPTTRWASEKHVLPQWLELSWDKPQDLRGVTVQFENAIAADYVIQTWDGNAWINQTVITRNTALERTHRFSENVKTSKMRIYVTAFSDYDRVSIWELEAYSAETTSPPAKIMIPREGNYMLAARVATGPDYGTIFFKVNDTLYSTTCNDSQNQFAWREIGPMSLEAGEQFISVGSDGPVELDEIMVYSLRDGEEFLNPNDLFTSSDPQVTLSYERLNPGAYLVHVNANESFDLVFSDSYDPYWKVFVDNQEISSNAAYSLVNSFRIDKTGQFTITVSFTGQSYADTGIVISAVSFCSISVSAPILSIISRRRRFLKLRKQRVDNWKKMNVKNTGTP